MATYRRTQTSITKVQEMRHNQIPWGVPCRSKPLYMLRIPGI